MNSIIRSLILALLFLPTGYLFSQDTFQELDKVYGLDPLVYNGKKYSYFLPSGTGGHQYWATAGFVEGDLVIKGSREAGRHGGTDLLLNYDVYNQKLLLKYFAESNAAQIIEVSEAWLESFRLGSSEFRLVTFNGQTRIYQVLGDGKYKILYYWRKDLKLTSTMGDGNYTFSAPVKSGYVFIGGELHSFGTKGSFTRMFNPAFKSKISNYIKEKKINLKKASDQVMKDLINYISNLD